MSIKYTEVTKIFIKEVQGQGFSLIGACDGEESEKFTDPEAAVDHIEGTGMGSLHFKKGDKKVWAGVLFDGEAQEVIYDYSISKDEAVAESFEKAWNAWHEVYDCE